MVLKTERLVLREYRMEDFEALFAILSDPETMAHYPKPYDAAGTDRWLQWSLNNYKEHGFGLWAVELLETGEFIGDCGITLQNIDGEILPEIGYHVAKTHWRQGFGKEAAKAVRDWAFQNTPYNTLYSYMTSSNIASQATAAAAGLKKVKEYIDDTGVPHTVYSISRDEWQALCIKEI